MAVREHRSLEKSLFSPGSRKFFRLKNDQVRLLFIGIVLNADDFGRVEGDVDDLVAMFPKMRFTAEDMAESIKNMADADLITQYKVEGEKYIEINNFVEHQNWNGISGRGSKIPPNPRTLKAASRSGRTELVAVVAEFPKNSAATPKSTYLPTNTKNTVEGTATATSSDAEDAYRKAKRVYRSKVGKSIGSMSNRGSQWEGLVRKHGVDVLVKAVEIWATELGKGGRNLDWPLAVFLKNADEFVEVACETSTESEQPDADLFAATIAADDLKRKKENEAFEEKLRLEDELAESTRGQF